MTAPNGGEPARGCNLTVSVSSDEPQFTSKLSRAERWRVRRCWTRCVTNATLAGNSHQVASTDLRVLDPHVAPRRSANDRPFADHVHLDRGTRLGAALQHDGRWYHACKAVHGSARFRRTSARAGRARGGGTPRSPELALHHCCGALGCGNYRHSVSGRVRAHQTPDQNVARAERGGRGPGRRGKKDVNITI